MLHKSAECSVCKRSVAVRGDGTLRVHAQRAPDCPGGGAPRDPDRPVQPDGRRQPDGYLLVTRTALGWESTGGGCWPTTETARMAAQSGEDIAAIYLLDKDPTE